MVKYISMFCLKPGFDPDETHRVWVEDHVPAFKRKHKGLLKRYVISRIEGISEEDSDWYGMVEMGFDDMESALKAIEAVKQEIGSRPDEFARRLTGFKRMFVIEQREIEL